MEDFFPSRTQREKQRLLLSHLARITNCYCLSRFNNPVTNLGAQCDLAASKHGTSVPSTPTASPGGPGERFAWHSPEHCSPPGLCLSLIYIQPLLMAVSRHDKSHGAGNCTGHESDRKLWATQPPHLFNISEFTACKTATEEPSQKVLVH